MSGAVAPVSYQLKTFTAPMQVADGPRLTAQETAAALFRQIFAELDGDREHFVVLTVSAIAQPVGYKVVSSGTASACLVHPREVFRAALRLGGVNIFVAHNHPSGDPSPSDEDIETTLRLQSAADILGMRLIDHLIMAGDRWTSVPVFGLGLGL